MKRNRVKKQKPVAPTVRMVGVKFYGGVMDGQTMMVPASTERIAIGPEPKPFFIYTYAGRDGNTLMFAKQAPSRVGRRFIAMYVAQTGKHPGIESSLARRKPVVGRTDKRRQGALRRSAVRVMRANAGVLAGLGDA